jgi:hypothetical protein
MCIGKCNWPIPSTLLYVSMPGEWHGDKGHTNGCRIWPNWEMNKKDEIYLKLLGCSEELGCDLLLGWSWRLVPAKLQWEFETNKGLECKLNPLCTLALSLSLSPSTHIILCFCTHVSKWKCSMPQMLAILEVVGRGEGLAARLMLVPCKAEGERWAKWNS